MFDGNFRTPFERGMAPVGRSLHRAGVSPDLVTALGVVMAAACAVAIGAGLFPLAVLLLALTGLPDALDGAVAKAAGRSGPRGAYLDSVSDRLSDGLLFGGCVWYYLGTDDPRNAIVPFGVFLAAGMVSYQRAKAESLGYEAKGGLMERAERFIALGFGLLFFPILLWVLWAMLILTTWTAITRFNKVWRQATVDQPARPDSARRRRRRRNAGAVSDFRRRAQARAAARRQRRP